MGISHVAVIAAISLSGLMPTSCSKAFFAKEAKQHGPGPDSATANSGKAVSTPWNTKELGELELTNHYETCVDLGAGRSCIITPKLLDRDSLQLTMALQSKQANGRTKDFIVTQVVTRPGKPFKVAVGNMDIAITPEITQQ